jgi:hypothetical protein
MSGIVEDQAWASWYGRRPSGGQACSLAAALMRSRQRGRIGRHVVSGLNRCGAGLVHVKEQPLVVVAAQTFHG